MLKIMPFQIANEEIADLPGEVSPLPLTTAYTFHEPFAPWLSYQFL